MPGVTRDSVIQLAKKWGIPCTERRIKIAEIIDLIKAGHKVEIFGTGTAAVISPVGLIRYQDQTYTVNDNKVGELTQKLYDTLTAIQYGRAEDSLGWIEKT